MQAPPNYIVDENPLNLAGPSPTFLRVMWEFDSSLVLVPSKQGFFYRLGQKRPNRSSQAIIAQVMKEQADAAMLLRYGLVPVTSIPSDFKWDNAAMAAALFDELARRAPWRQGGHEAFSKAQEAEETKERLDAAIKVDEVTTGRAKDAWGFYRMKAGLQSHMYIPKTAQPKATQENQAPGLRFPKPAYRPIVITDFL